MNLSVVVIVGAVVLASVVLIGGLLYERRKSSPNYYERTRSPRYESMMRDHRNAFLWTSGLGIVLAVIPLADWSTFGFRSEWRTVSAYGTTVQSVDERDRHGYPVYVIFIWYSYTIDGTVYNGSARFPYGRDQAYRDREAASMRAGNPITIWYHPLLKGLNFASRITPIYDIILLCCAGFVGIGSLSSLVNMIRIQLTDNY